MHAKIVREFNAHRNTDSVARTARENVVREESCRTDAREFDARENTAGVARTARENVVREESCRTDARDDRT